MKILKWGGLALLALLVIGGLIYYFTINSIIRSTVEKQTSNSLNLPTELGGANLSLFGKTLSLDDLEIGSPPGFAAPRMFSLDDISVAVKYGELNDDPVRISEITIEEPRLVIERAGGKFNIQAVMDQQPKTPPAEEGEPIKLIIGRLNVREATVVLRPGLPGLAEEITVAIPPIELDNIGSGEGNQNGAAIKEVVMQVITAMAAKASESDQLPEQLKQLLNLDIQQIAAQLSGEFNKQLGKISEEIGKQLPPEVGKAVEEIIKQSPAGEDLGKAVEEGLGGLLNQGKKSRPAPTTQP